MKFRNIRRYLFIQLCVVFIVLGQIAWNIYEPLDDFIKPTVGYWYAGAPNFICNLADFACFAWFLFFLEIPIRFIIMKFILKKKEAPIPVPESKVLRFLDGLYTLTLWIFVFYAPFETLCLSPSSL